MATPGRQEDLAVERAPLAERLEREPWPFRFFQAVRLLQLLARNREPVGRYSKPGDEAVRFGANSNAAFPASEIQTLTPQPGRPPFMRVNFMGLTGPEGVLPLNYSSLIVERQRARDYAGRDFLDIFNHRVISLFYQAWEKYRFEMAFERGERDRFSHHLLDLVGLGTAGLQDRQEIPDQALLFYAGMLGMHTRSAAALEQIVEDYFGVPAHVEQFVGAWYTVESDNQCCLGEEGRLSESLGLGTVVGDEIWDEQSRVSIRLGPLTLAQYHDFLPGGSAHRLLSSLLRFYGGMEFDIEVQLVLRREEVPACELRPQEGEGVQLGWTSWVKSAPMRRDPDEAVLQFEQAH